ncbi:MAG TPA: glycosyltransferase family 4 protein, partial [Planctomycetota bacterium]|nr:glycosyltransferase family 4 protein [Planctomycetota bacterium]
KSRERALARALSSAAREAGADVTIGIRHLEEVDVFWPHAGAHMRGLEAREAARQRVEPAVGEGEAPSEEEIEASGRHALFQDLERQLCEGGGARRIVCVSELVRDELAELYPACAPRLAVVPNGIDLEHFSLTRRAERRARLRTELGVAADAPLVAFLAHDAELKGLPTLLDALASLARPDVHLLLGGPRPLARWKRRAERVLGPERVHAFDALDAAHALSAADVLAHPTWRDTSGLVLLEAQAVGTPVVTTRRAGDAGVVREGVSGTVLAEAGDALTLAAALKHWLERARNAKVDHAAVRAAVESRDLASWLAAMEAIVLQAAEESIAARGR